MRPGEFFRFNKETYKTAITTYSTVELQSSHDLKKQKYKSHKKWQPYAFLISVITHGLALSFLVYSMRYTDIAFSKIMIIRDELEKRTMIECQDLVRSAGPDGGIELSNEDVQLLLRAASHLDRNTGIDEKPPAYEDHKEQGTTVKIRRSSGSAALSRNSWI